MNKLAECERILKAPKSLLRARPSLIIRILTDEKVINRRGQLRSFLGTDNWAIR